MFQPRLEISLKRETRRVYERFKKENEMEGI